MKKYFTFIALLLVIVFTFTSTDNKQNTHSSDYPLFTVKCKNTSIPDFKLGHDATPSDEEVTQLCGCIWGKFVDWEKETAIKLTSGKKDEISAVHMVGFPAIFGKRISECGGEKL